LPSPTADPFYIDYVSHETAHAFGASHTFNSPNGVCGDQRTASTAYEPGSGSTLMAYAGLCPFDNVEGGINRFFHSASIDQIQAYIAGKCGVPTPTGNRPPSVGAGADYTIPASTPFVLTATGSDPDGDALTFSWEERDLGPAQQLVSRQWQQPLVPGVLSDQHSEATLSETIQHSKPHHARIARSQREVANHDAGTKVSSRRARQSVRRRRCCV
jgi:hypothetical protein